jgi:hypothetical protein
MTSVSEFESRRRANIKQNAALLEELGITQQSETIREATKKVEPARKERKIETRKQNLVPSRSSTRIASTTSQPVYNEEVLVRAREAANRIRPKGEERLRSTHSHTVEGGQKEQKTVVSSEELDFMQQSWRSWQPVARPAIRDDTGVFHFESHPEFKPNRSPEEVLREGCFGGSYFRPLFSKHLGINVSDDYLELPAAWTDGLDIELYLISPQYDPDINKFKVACGQSIEEWEKAGWINHTYDVRGWFQWYCRFFMGRRCEDDDRQVSRWKKCVGTTGRWRRMLLKKYVSAGVREVFDDGEDEEQEEVSPVMHQTCHHWAFCVTQDVLDEHWMTEK